MRLIDNRDCRDPHWNLALEEWCVRNLEPEPRYVLFYVNEPSVIVGKNQNTEEEIDAEFVRERGIHVVRRISGGGAVYHDHGNLNFSFLAPFRVGTKARFRDFTEPVVRALRAMGVEAELSGRNDIVVGGRKISGNAQFTTVRSMFSHGTLLLDSNLDDVVRALTVRDSKFESKGVKSIRSRVANIAEFLDERPTVEAFRETLVEHLFDGAGPEVRRLSDAEREEVRELADTKYRTWEWNYGRSPKFNVRRVRRFPIGELDARIDVRDGRIAAIRIFGDYLGTGDVGELEARLVGTRYAPDDLARALEGVDLAAIFGDLAPGDLVAFLHA